MVDGWVANWQITLMNTSANKVVIVTGSATGIGYETAVRLSYIRINEKPSESKWDHRDSKE